MARQHICSLILTTSKYIITSKQFQKLYSTFASRGASLLINLLFTIVITLAWTRVSTAWYHLLLAYIQYRMNNVRNHPTLLQLICCLIHTCSVFSCSRVGVLGSAEEDHMIIITAPLFTHSRGASAKSLASGCYGARSSRTISIGRDHTSLPFATNYDDKESTVIRCSHKTLVYLHQTQ